MTSEMEEISRSVLQACGTDISRYDKSFLIQSIETRCSETGCHSLPGYITRLRENPDEAGILAESLQNTYSEFFRNPLAFAYLEQVVLPLLAGKKRKRKGSEIRAWCSDCAAGQEPYSLAILMDEINASSPEPTPCRIFATDISEKRLEEARRGLFHSYSLGNLSHKRFRNYFSGREELFRIDPKLKEYIDFSFFDLLAEEMSCPPPSIYGNFDIIFCCNILFYYRPEFRRRILKKIDHCLAPGGFLVSGETEREIMKEGNFREIVPNSAIFCRKTVKFADEKIMGI
jgi:chemotaxis methyl-accepting protein methylase